MKDKERLRKRYDELIALIVKYNHHYYDLSQPLVDDAAYDELLRELVGIEQKHPSLARDDSPGRRVGGTPSRAFAEVAHEPPMLSLGNIFDENELREFDKRCMKNLERDEELVYSMELKFDGLAVEIVYEKGRYARGSTRGNGEVGEDVTDNLATIKSIPLALRGGKAPEYLSVRGEVYMRHGEFERINREREEKGEQLFANPRNAAAGSLRQLDPKVTEERDLDIVLYGAGGVSGEVPITSQSGMFAYFREAGLPVSEHRGTGDIESVIGFYRRWMENRHELDFDIDGVVVKIDDFSLRDRLGVTSKAPRWATAWKFPAREAITVLLSVDCQIGRTGLVTPVANLHPINIGGVLVKRATLHNFDEVERLGIMIGDSIKVIRAGDVIPKVVQVLEDRRPFNAEHVRPPERCPSCNSVLRKEEIYIRCVNDQCEGKRLEVLKFFVSKDAMDMEFFGPELVQRLYRAGKVNSPADIFKLKAEDLLQVERMGEKIAEKILDSINKRKVISLAFLLRSLGIRNVGDHLAKVIARGAGTLERLSRMGVEELMSMNEVGPGVAESVYAFFRNPGNASMIQDMMKAGVRIAEEAPGDESRPEISGKTFVVTGTLKRYSRKEAEDLIEKAGGRASGSVSKKTDYIVAGESPGSKFERGRELGVTILTEEDFMKMVGAR